MDFEYKNYYNLHDLQKIMEILCDKDIGCEWDKIQTHKSIRQNFIEEAYEAVDAIDKDDKELMKEELGDVLLQVVYHAYFEQREGGFTLDDVIDGVAQKMVVRHPHIFNGEKAKDVEDALKKWEEIKNKSHGHNTITKTLDAVPKNFPALMYSQKVQKRVQAGGVPVPSVKEEIDNIKHLTQNIEKSIDETGISQKDLAGILFSTVNIIRQSNFDAEETLGLYNQKFVEIFTEFEKISLQNSLDFGTIGFAMLEKIWKQAEAACGE